MGEISEFCLIQDFLKEFISNIRENDPLPVRAPSYEISESEIDGQILDIVYHYLNQRHCHPYIKNLVAHRVWNGMQNSVKDCDDVDGPTQNKQPFYDALKLIRDVTNSANTVIKDVFNTLSPSQVHNLPKYLPISHYCIKNSRRKMEDRCIIHQDLNVLYDMKFGYPHSYYAVFDGHCGPDGAIYAAAHLHQFLIQNPLYSTNLEAALKHAFHICDTNFIKRSEKERLKGGTTAVVALVRENRLVVAWLGDSQALLVRKRNAAHVGEPHTPARECERKRIEDIGGAGTVLDIGGTWRVLGQLAVSRAIGDADYKPLVSSECDIKSLEISGDEDFLILACDGLWDTLTPKEAVNLVYAYLMQNEGDTDGVGKCLVEAARLAGSEDNITAVVVFLRPVTSLMAEEASRVEKGEVTDFGKVIPVSKDSQPHFITNLFSQPHQEEVSKVNNNFETNDALAHFDPPPYMEEPAPDYDMDNIAENDIVPTDEEVDAVLAELDSIPDAHDAVDDSSDDGEEWTYAKVEPRTLTQVDDILPATLMQDNTETILDPSIVDLSIDKVSVPLNQVNSLRSVEGFITSVELNAEPESTEFNAPDLLQQKMEQSSGPFSVYVSSSPEPSSIEAVVQGNVSTFSPVQDTQEETNIPCTESSAVEIVHAQSTIEVTSKSEDDFTPIFIPDIMTQSFTGDLPVSNDNFDINSSLYNQPILELDSDNAVTVCNNFSSENFDIIEPPQEHVTTNSILDINEAQDNVTTNPILDINEAPQEDVTTNSIFDINKAPQVDVTTNSIFDINELSQEPVNTNSNLDIKSTKDSLLEFELINRREVFGKEVTSNIVTTLADLDESYLNAPSMEVNSSKTRDDILAETSTIDHTIETTDKISEENDLVEEKTISGENIIPSKREIDDILDTTNETNLFNKNDTTVDVTQKTDVEPTEVEILNEIVSPKLKVEVTSEPIKSIPQIKEKLPTHTKKVTPSLPQKKITKEVPKQTAKPPSKIDRLTTRKTVPVKETLKPQLKKDSLLVKKSAPVRTITKTATSSFAKSTVASKPTTKPVAAKQPEKFAATNRLTSATERTKKPISNLTIKSKINTKSTEKNSIPEKASVATRRPVTTARPTTTRPTAAVPPRSAAFAPPTKDTKNTTNKLLSSKTSSSVLNRPKIKTAPTTENRSSPNKQPVGLKKKILTKPSPITKGKEELLTNGNAKNLEKESAVEKTEKEIVYNGEP